MHGQIPLLSLLLLLVGCVETALEPRATGADEPHPGQAMALAQATFGINIDPDNPAGNPSGATLGQLGARIARFSFKDDSEGFAPDPARLSHYRAKIEELNRAGIRTLLLLDYETVPGFPAMSDDRARWDAYRAKFTARVRAIAAALGDEVHAYEIWNEMDEPNNRPEYAPYVPPARYGELLRDAYFAIRAHSQAAIVTGGADSGDPGYLEQARAAAGGLFADGVGLHPYGQRPEPGFPSPDWGFGELETLVNAYHARLGLPVWITEFGTEDESIQAEYLSRAFARIAGPLAGKVARAVWFCWSDGMVAPFGVVDGAGNPKPAWHAFHGFAGAVVPPPPHWQLPDALVTAVWTEPAEPRAGEPVRFFARVLNRGGRTTGQHVGVAYFVNGQQVTWGAERALESGEALEGFQGVGAWLAREGPATITAVVDDVDRFREGDEQNNGFELPLTVRPAQSVPDAPRLVSACFTTFHVPGDAAPTLRADLEVEVPAWAWTQPMGSAASSCDWFWPGESFRARFPELTGAWRLGVDVHGPAQAREQSGVDHPWRFALLDDGCGVHGNVGVPAKAGRYTVTGFVKLAPGDEADASKFYAGVVQEGHRWAQDGVGCTR
ncbi:MAG: CARDB domain-containing protein [Myxococcales bacterium]